MRDRLTAVCLLTVMAAQLVALASGWDAPHWASWAAMLAVVPLSWDRLGLREGYLLTLCAVLSALLWWNGEPEGARVALDQAAFLMAFILLIGLIQQAAMTSDAILRCGEYLTRQPPDRRYFAVFGGTHLMAQLFNLGVVSLLAPLIRRGTERDGDLGPIRERRQLSAMLQGFAWGVIWSPTAVAPLVLMTLIPGTDRFAWIGVGLVIAAVVMLIGWAEDHWRWQSYAGVARGMTPPALPRGAVLEFVAVAIALLALTLAAMEAFDQSVVSGLMAASPVLMLAWLLRQRAEGVDTASRLREIALGHLPKAAPLAVTLACSGFVGRAAAALIPVAEWAEAAGVEAWPGWLFLLGLSVGVMVLSQLALSPIMMAVFFGSLIAGLPELPADKTWAALAISCGWALSMTASPFATVVLMTAGATGHSGREMTWQWNWLFTLLCVGALAVFYVILA